MKLSSSIRPTVILRNLIIAVSVFLVGWFPALPRRAEGTEAAWDSSIRTLSQAGPNGAGSAEARLVARQLVRHGPEILPALLAAMNTENPVAANWLRTVFDEIYDREFAQTKRAPVSLEVLKRIACDPGQQGKLRRLALHRLDGLEPEFSRGLIPTLLRDPEFRGDAVDLAVARGDALLAAGQRPEASAVYHSAFQHARLPAQVRAVAGKLRAVGQKPDIIAHMGLIVNWQLIGPFDAPGTSGFKTAFPPEAAVDLQARYPGQGGQTLRWVSFRNADLTGELDLTKAVAQTSEAVAYCYAELSVPQAVNAQVRCGADDNCTVWINSEKVLSREQWLNSSRTDRFIAPIQLRAGKNSLLVKVCQGPRHVDPTVPNNWSLQMRICAADGLGVPFQPQMWPSKPE